VTQAPEGTEALVPFSAPLLPAPARPGQRPGGVLVEDLHYAERFSAEPTPRESS